MRWSFIIIYLDGIYLEQIINSIKNQNNLTKDKFEIILIGPDNHSMKKVKSSVDVNIVFDESIVTGWITMKKNIGVQHAKYENVCIMHDYVGLCENWYNGYLTFGDNWDVCLNPVRTTTGSRYWDWISIDTSSNRKCFAKFISYEDLTQTKTYMYVGGTYWCAKRQFMTENSLDINMVHNGGEDVEWSMRCKDKWDYKLNLFSVSRLMKDKEVPIIDPNPSEIYSNSKIQL